MAAVLTPQIGTLPRDPVAAPGPARRGPSRRLIVLGVAVIMALTLVRGLFWVATFPVWSGDEGAHYSYVASVATGQGIPVAGRSLDSADSLRVIKASPIATERTFPLPATPSTQWGVVSEGYESWQPPLYYVLLTPVYWLGRAIGGVLGAIYALRIASLLMAVAAIPLVAFLARALLPERRAVWLLAPAFIAVLQIVNVQNSYVDNDGLTMVAGSACLLALLASRGDLRIRKGVLFGAALAAAVLTKATLWALAPALIIAAVAYVVKRKPSFRSAATWAAAAGGTFAVIFLPYLVFNLVQYHALSGVQRTSALLKPVFGSTPLSVAGLQQLTATLLRMLFVGQGIAPTSVTNEYQLLLKVTALALAAAALGAAAALRRRDELAIMAWIVVSIPLGTVTLVVLGYSQSGSGASIAARFLDCLLPLFAILMGYGAVAALGSRAGSLALLSVLVASSFLEVTSDRFFVTTNYAADIIGHSVPAVEQSYADGRATLTNVRASASCRVDAVALSFWGAHPPEVVVNGKRSLPAMNEGTLWTAYRLTSPMTGNIAMRFPGTPQMDVERPRQHLVVRPVRVAETPAGVPAVRLYCSVADPAVSRFDELYPTSHPPLSMAELLAWPEVEAWIEFVLVATVAGIVIWGLAAPTGAHARRSRIAGH
jgi:4-amino-4-deoxy-L-arabinose transferase-like glycosyltransferase